MTSQREISHLIGKTLTPGVRKYLWNRLKIYGYAHTLEHDELNQYMHIATWKALLSDPQLLENGNFYGLKIYNKLLDLLRNVGVDGLGMGLRKANTKFSKQAIRGLDLDASLRLHCLSTQELPIDRVGRDLTRDQIICELMKFSTQSSTLKLAKRLRLVKGNHLTTLVARAQKTLVPLIRMAAAELDSPVEGVRLFQEALDYYKLSA